MRRAILTLAVLSLVACKDRTELVIGVATDLIDPDEISRVELHVRRAGSEEIAAEVGWDIFYQANMDFNLPGSYGIVSEDDRKVDLELVGFRRINGSDVEVVKRTARLGILEGETLFYRLGLTGACESRAQCPDGLTCIEGSCRPIEVDFRFLPSYTETIAEQVTCIGSTTYIDTTTSEPMAMSADAASCPDNLCAEGTCLVPPHNVPYCECVTGETCIGGVCVPTPAPACALRPAGQQCCPAQDDNCKAPDLSCNCDEACNLRDDCCADICTADACGDVFDFCQ